MTLEKRVKSPLLSAQEVDPEDIGQRETQIGHLSLRVSDRLNSIARSVSGFVGGARLTTFEKEDLMRIDPAGLTLDRIKLYAANHVLVFESEGKVRRNKTLEREYVEAKQLLAWLETNNYELAAAFMLKQARKCKGMPWGKQSTDEYVMKIVSDRTINSIPQEIQTHGETATLQYMSDHQETLVLVLASSSSAMYLKQAAFLVRLFVRTSIDHHADTVEASEFDASQLVNLNEAELAIIRNVVERAVTQSMQYSLIIDENLKAKEIMIVAEKINELGGVKKMFEIYSSLDDFQKLFSVFLKALFNRLNQEAIEYLPILKNIQTESHQIATMFI